MGTSTNIAVRLLTEGLGKGSKYRQHYPLRDGTDASGQPQFRQVLVPRATVPDQPELLEAIAGVSDIVFARLEDPDDALAQFKVFEACVFADLDHAATHRELLVELFRRLDETHQVNLLRGGQERQTFWYGILREARVRGRLIP